MPRPAQIAAALPHQIVVNQYTMEQEMPAETKQAAQTELSHRWLAAAVTAASEPLPALPFDRANRIRPASLGVSGTARSGSVAAH
jgi:hypothetical protein